MILKQTIFAAALKKSKIDIDFAAVLHRHLYMLQISKNKLQLHGVSFTFFLEILYYHLLVNYL